MSENVQTENDPEMKTAPLVARSAIGGLLMGLANLVPGISGGTMLLATGIYPSFIKSLADVTRLRFKFRSVLVLSCVVAAAGLGILLFAGTLKELVVNHRWVMYSLFIGLTLGGLPLVWKLAKPASTGLLVAAGVAFALMVVLVVLQANGFVGGGGGSNYLTLFLAGLAGSSAMILPGLSGGYLLLLMGQYVPILKAVDEFKDAISARDISAAITPAIGVLIPVGVGVVLGIVLVGNLLDWLFRRYRKLTLGVLIGLLLGATVGLFPFQVGVQPKVGDFFKSQVVTAESLKEIDADKWPTEYYTPDGTQVVMSLLLVVVGLAATYGVSMIGGKNDDLETK